ncbi:hypothetical protein H257_05626 [Aphanomyces astaci]|uniref:HTH psq-type domain-containing protein n=1 Tax=Aphanomyces astaci TaxID=112090 RepID=W4GR08_APHAT|nr:hypothetical protein H257_05626 [Aphanomyces astaci]ETV82122.1 hypothetical protein H257_05626 [Aphanomyces astaci]|eukprot:XP_009828859.1 hypothetical protein H257_05626 [Aphanomyces astaci]
MQCKHRVTLSSSRPPGKKRRYTPEDLEQAVQEVVGGMRGTEVAHAANIPYEVVMRRIRLIKPGKEVVVQRRGPKPTLAKSCEEDLVAWISGMQSRGYPTSHYTILVKLGPSWIPDGWLVIWSARNSIDEAGVALLFDSMGEAMKEHNC